MNTAPSLTPMTDMSPDPTAKIDFLRLTIAAVAGALLLAGAGFWPTARLAGDAGIRAMLMGIGVSALGSLVAALPLAFSRSALPAARMNAFLGAMAARMGVALALFLVVILCELAAEKPFAIWMAISYLWLLGIETVVAVGLVKRRANASR